MRRWRFRDLPLGRKLFLIVLPISGFGLLVAMVSVTLYSGVNLQRDIVRHTVSLAEVVGDNTSGALSFGDSSAAERTLDGLGAVPTIRLACLYSTSRELRTGLVASYPAAARKVCPLKLPPEHEPSIRSGRLEVVASVSAADETVGRLYLERDLGELRDQLGIQAATGTLVFIFALAVIAALLGITQSRIVAPILNLSRMAVEIRRTRNYHLRAPKGGRDEVGSLIASFNAMLDEIEGAQKQLVESEKMAALGGLVAGVAHEVNTPIGIGVTAASHLRQELQSFQETYRAGQVTQQQLERLLRIGDEATQLLMTHLERAADLIAGFKQVAVDQTADAHRELDLASYLREVALSVMPKFRNTPYELRVEAEGPIEIDSYPGAIAQIVTNLAINALVHGLDARERGTVTIVAGQSGEDVTLSVRDDGRGIPASSHKNLFQPFFTTRRNAGGTGLGLHVVYNLVTQRLRGTIRFDSEEGRGTTFTITFPRRTPAP